MSTVRETWGLACPRCHSDEDIIVLATEYVRLVPDGSISVSDQEWSHESSALCTNCEYCATVQEFTVEEGGQP